MGDVLVDSLANQVHPHKKPSPSADPSDTLHIADDDYTTYKRLQRELEYINLQEEYIKDEQR